MILWFGCVPRSDLPETADVVIAGTPDASAMPQAVQIADLTGDGADDVVAGGGYRDQTCVFSGPFVADRAWSDGQCWESEAAADLSGFALASGDLDGDGQIDLAIGAPFAAAVGFQRGRAYVVGAPAAHKVNLSTAALVFDGANDLDSFGISVLVLDGDGDGAADLLVGAVGNDDGGPGGGQVYLFRGPLVSGTPPDTSIFGSDPTLRHASGEPGDGVGYAMAAPGDLDGDGLGDLLLAAGGHDDPATDVGLAALFFTPLPSGRSELGGADVQFPGSAPNGWLGEPCGGADDLDGDGHREVLLGATGEEIGHLYRYQAPFSAVAPQAIGGWVGAAPFDGVGVSFHTRDIDGDGATDALVAAPYADSRGAVGLFYGPIPDGALGLDAADQRWTGESDASLGRVLASGELDGLPGIDLAIAAPSSRDGGTIRLFFAGSR